MNYGIIRRALALGIVSALAGCTTGTDCSSALDRAGEAAKEQLPLGEWLDGVDNACTETAIQTWTDALSESCAPVYGFHVGSSGGQKPGECTGAGFNSAWSLGETISGMQREVTDIERQLEDGTLTMPKRRELERRLIVIDRDLPQVEAIARLEGYLPPADIPDRD